ncbi:hypothetical protein [Streptomyces luteocolor]|uniref:hypothetical protein n=1 Tax=Streptomyces luteocolor TaxID=285500 RepID=UPI00114CF2E5|nr:hypothetical protein [Streptomyces luteocolor]
MSASFFSCPEGVAALGAIAAVLGGIVGAAGAIGGAVAAARLQDRSRRCEQASQAFAAFIEALFTWDSLVPENYEAHLPLEQLRGQLEETLGTINATSAKVLVLGDSNFKAPVMQVTMTVRRTHAQFVLPALTRSERRFSIPDQEITADMEML